MSYYHTNLQILRLKEPGLALRLDKVNTIADGEFKRLTESSKLETIILT
jgi:hypothetical protein